MHLIAAPQQRISKDGPLSCKSDIGPKQTDPQVPALPSRLLAETGACQLELAASLHEPVPSSARQDCRTSP